MTERKPAGLQAGRRKLTSLSITKYFLLLLWTKKPLQRTIAMGRKKKKKKGRTFWKRKDKRHKYINKNILKMVRWKKNQNT